MDKKDDVLRRLLGPMSLMLLGIGFLIGAGIFILTGTASANFAGPAITFSFIFCTATVLLTALCYTEFATMVPLTGSAYTYSYITLGEIWAWIIGWDLLLEYTVEYTVLLQLLQLDGPTILWLF
ncbi:MAG: amino acid permease [Methanobacterium sp.]|nr:amino acid permease [Methanobacterium sp.]